MIVYFYAILSKKKKGSSNRKKARQRLAKVHLKVSRQRKDFAVKLAEMKTQQLIFLRKD